MSLDPRQVRRIAQLARIAIKEDDIPRLQSELNSVLDLIEAMRAVDISQVEPMAHAQDLQQRLRDDVVDEPDRSADLLALAPEAEAGLFLAPKVIE